MVSTSDSDSGNLGSIPGTTSLTLTSSFASSEPRHSTLNDQVYLVHAFFLFFWFDLERLGLAMIALPKHLRRERIELP
jgi:hypothetical protein